MLIYKKEIERRATFPSYSTGAKVFWRGEGVRASGGP
jgi:hypothetical protein